MKILPIAALCGLLIAAPVAALGPLAMLGTLNPGGWDVRYREGSGQGKLCLRTGRELLQLRVPSQSCDRIVVSDKPTEVTVQYTCKGAGYVRTQIRKETGSLVQISSQGVAGGKPFQFSAEARRTGACSR